MHRARNATRPPKRPPAAPAGALLLALAAAVALLVCALPAAAAPGDDPDAGVAQTDGRVSDVLRVGGRIYLGGTFQHVNGQPRSRLAAIDADTGALTPWNPGANAWVMALAASPDGSRVYAGGGFSRVDGTSRTRLAAIDAGSGEVVGAWNPRADAAVRAIATLGDRVYLGGDFLSVNGEPRARLAAVGASDGTPDPTWRPEADDTVYHIAATGDGSRVYAGGAFRTISGQSRANLVRMNVATGVPSSWKPRPGRPVLDFSLAGTRAYTAEGGAGGAAGAYDTASGATEWKLTGDGDAQAVAVHDGLVYVGGHFDVFGGQSRRKLAAVDPATGALDPRWSPSTDRGVWALTPDAGRGHLYAGGDFTRVNGQPRQGIARFSEGGGPLARPGDSVRR